MKAVFTINYKNEDLKKIEELGYKIIIRKGELKEEDYDCDVLHCFKSLTSENISKFTNLKFVQLASIGFEHLPKKELLKTDIVISNQNGIYSKPIGEWIVFNILQIIKQNKKIIDNQKIKKWEFINNIDELEGKIILFLGTGSIAVEAIKRLFNYGVKLIGLNSNGRHIDGFDECARLSEIDEFLPKADFVINVLPATDSTINFINKELFIKFKKDSNFINVSRGSVVNENDLIEALNSGIISNVCLDVFIKEPLSDNSPLWNMENVYISPHISWSSSKKKERVFNNLYNNMKNFIENKPLENIVDLKKGY